MKHAKTCVKVIVNFQVFYQPCVKAFEEFKKNNSRIFRKDVFLLS